MYHGEQSDFLISRTLTKSTQSKMITSDSESCEDEGCSITGFAQQNIFQDMVHVALRTRQGLLDTLGHSGIWKGIDLAHVEQVIPNSLYLFVRLLFGSIHVAHEDIEKYCKIDQTVCSIAQDIVYGVSNRRKLTPKHVGLGLALHQATRSEALVQLFHAANHTIVIDTVRRIDTTIAQNIIDRFAKNGYVYIPENIVNDRMLHCSCDICARSNYRQKEHIPPHADDGVAERTRSTTISRRFRERENVLRPRAVKPSALQEFQRLDHVHLPSGKRPPPSFGDDNTNEIELFGSSCYVERQSARLWLGWCHGYTMTEMIGQFLLAAHSTKPQVPLIFL